MKEGFLPDSISTDLHIGSMNAGMKDMLNVMDKFLAMGMSLDDVIARSTWNPAREIKQEELGHLSVGAAADVAVLRLERAASASSTCTARAWMRRQRLTCELTVRDGKVVYDLNGIVAAGLEDAARTTVRRAIRAGTGLNPPPAPDPLLSGGNDGEVESKSVPEEGPRVASRRQQWRRRRARSRRAARRTSR